MTATLDTAIDQLFQVYQQGQSLALLFDYDGTLTPIVEHPQLARLNGGTVDLLKRLADRPRIGLGVISGRMLAELKELVRIPKICLAGTSGLEIELGGMQIHHPRVQEAKQLMWIVAQKIDKHIAGFAGAWLENKGLGLTVHYRSVAEEAQIPLQTAVYEAIDSFCNEIRVVRGPRALEITPDIGWSKCTAVKMIMQYIGAANQGVLYAGDGANDADAFEFVLSLGGISLGVGPQAPSMASHRLPDPDALLGFLDLFNHSLDLN